METCPPPSRCQFLSLVGGRVLSATSLHNDLFNDKEISDNTMKRLIWFQSFLGLPYVGMNTSRICVLKAMRQVLEDLFVQIWNFEREMVG